MIEYQKDTVIRGLSLSGGLAIARVCLFNSKRHSNLPVYHVAGEGVEREYERLDRALQVAGERLAAVRDRVKERIGAAESEIFTAQQMIMQDESMLTQVRALIDDGGNAEMAIQEVLDRFESRLLAVDNDYIKERASDIGEVKRRLLDVLGNMQPQLQCAGLDHCQHGYNRVVVAEELTPTLTVDLDTQHTLGFVTERGGANSHAAILARALGIPAVSGIKDIHSLISCGTEVLIDGDRGEFIIAPGNETKKRYLAQHADEKNEPQSVAPVEALAVSANISVATDMPMVCRAQAEGIGLYRTEFEFITAGRDLSEDEQFERYASVVRAAKDYPVTFRLLDVGGDKPLAFIDMPREENPALGCRGARFLLRYPALLQTQARAIARASEIAPVRVMYPMIVSKDQFLALKAIFLEAVEVFDPARIAHGVMFEAPSACLQAKAILQVADFAS
ncbi:MAG: phosphoenolpyruvate--protein phosphotransferase, partial [Spartobacteria bacterium]|nr:phosphoenolpyruvate--protein phosphotransferase [Spartobacteria bacterium]